MGISRFGSRYDEKIAAAKAAEEAEAARRAAMTPKELAAEAVSNAALDFETLEKTGDALANALKRALEMVEKDRRPKPKVVAGGWMEATGGKPPWARRAGIVSTFSFEAMSFTIKVARDSRSKDFVVYDETLNRVSESTGSFNQWMMSVAEGVFDLMDHPLHDAGNTPYPTHVKAALVKLEKAEVRAIGFHGPAQRAWVDEEAEAIASIKRTLGVDQ